MKKDSADEEAKKKNKHSVDAAKMMKALAEKKVGTRPCFWPMHKQPVFLNRESKFYQPHFDMELDPTTPSTANHNSDLGIPDTDYPYSEYLSENSFYIPSGLGMTDADIKVVAERVIAVVHELFPCGSSSGSGVSSRSGSAKVSP